MYAKKVTIFLFLVLFFCLSACTARISSSQTLQIKILDGNSEQSISIPSGSTVQQTLARAGLTLESLDRTEPPSYTVIDNPITISIVRVKEEFTVKDIEVPFERQSIKNESLLMGETRLLQPGMNGHKQVTYRKLFENGKQISESIFSQTTITAAIPEIIMVGVAKPFNPVTIPGKLAYIVAGNAWLMEGSTGNRSPIVTTGDLDGYVFTVSYDGKWLLYSRKTAQKASEMNSLWVVSLDSARHNAIDLGISNVISHADWVPGQSNTITFSTVEPISSAPGWQSDNNLFVLSFSEGGSVWRNEKVIETNGGGQYGWWGTDYYWSPDGSTLAFSRPDSIGYVDFANNNLITTLQVLPYNTHSDWAWVSPLEWSPDSKRFFFSTHITSDSASDPESSPIFSLASMSEADAAVSIISDNCGMFANPVPSPITRYGHYYLAAYKAIDPNLSNSSRYKLILMDRDGSNSQVVFPPPGSAGMDPTRIVWSPDQPLGQPYYLAIIYEKNLWLIDSESGDNFQVTGDGLIDNLDWK